MKCMKRAGLLFALASLAAAAPVQNPGAPHVLARAFEHRLVSATVGDSYLIQVRLPEKYDPAKTRYPVLYVLDADYWFGAASDIATYLAMVRESPAMIVVGVAYGGTRHDWYRKRARDFTPTARFPESVKEAPLGGHAAEFQRFLAGELIPFVEQNYPADPGDRILAGFSLGGLFTLHTLFTQPGLFQRYIAIAPAVQWDRRQLFETEAAFHARGARLAATVFTTHGDRDELQNPADWQEFDRLVASRGYEGLCWTSHLFPGETHVSVYPAGLTRGLKAVRAAASTSAFPTAAGKATAEVGAPAASSSPPPAVARTLPRPDLVLHYTDHGQGEPVLLLMGGPGIPGAGLEPVARMIAKVGRAIVPDQRGSGRSMPADPAAITLDATLADLEALRKELGLEKWTVWGCSWGGMLAMDYAAKFPPSVKALVLVDSGGVSWASFKKAMADNMSARMDADDRAALRYWSQPEVVARDPGQAAVERMRAGLPSSFYDRTKAWEAIALFQPGKERFNPEAGAQLEPAYDQGAAARREALQKLEIPTLIIHGRQDPVPESVALANQALLKGSRLVWLDRCGHWPWIEQPAALEKALLEFLAPGAPGPR
ncbi:MAG TPA: alpha/beta fold hydrolase [Lacunisphaera sp.]|nr:alpha/beta fold hydrolase [Lacunisphaera sp.]